MSDTPDQFEGNIGANIAGGRYPHRASSAARHHWNFLTVWHLGFYWGAVWMGSLLGLIWMVTR